MKDDFAPWEMEMAAGALRHLAEGRLEEGIEHLRFLKDAVHGAIPPKLRIGRGITWVVERVAALMLAQSLPEERLHELALQVHAKLGQDDLLIGVPIFLVAAHGLRHPAETLAYFETAAAAPHWVVREFAAGAFRRMITPNRDFLHPWLLGMARSNDPNVRRFASETLRPVTSNRWLFREPEYSLVVLLLLFKEPHPYPRTSVGNNLSDLSRRQPELVYGLVGDLVASGDPNSGWIAHRACRNLVKVDPRRVMDLLRVDEYHYKNRNFYRNGKNEPATLQT